MSFELAFLEEALAEWRKLDDSIRTPLKKKLVERLQAPRVPSAKLSGHPDRHKIKLRTVGYSLVYEVRDEQVLVIVMAVGKRDRNAVYRTAQLPDKHAAVSGARSRPIKSAHHDEPTRQKIPSLVCAFFRTDERVGQALHRQRVL